MKADEKEEVAVVQSQRVSYLGKMIKSLFWAMQVMSPSVGDTWLFYWCKPGRDLCQQSPVTHFQSDLKFTQAPFKLCNLNGEIHKSVGTNVKHGNNLSLYSRDMMITRSDALKSIMSYRVRPSIIIYRCPNFTRPHRWPLPCCYFIWVREGALFNFRFH